MGFDPAIEIDNSGPTPIVQYAGGEDMRIPEHLQLAQIAALQSILTSPSEIARMISPDAMVTIPRRLMTLGERNAWAQMVSNTAGHPVIVSEDGVKALWQGMVHTAFTKGSITSIPLPILGKAYLNPDGSTNQEPDEVAVTVEVREGVYTYGYSILTFGLSGINPSALIHHGNKNIYQLLHSQSRPQPQLAQGELTG